MDMPQFDHDFFWQGCLDIAAGKLGFFYDGRERGAFLLGNQATRSVSRDLAADPLLHLR